MPPVRESLQGMRPKPRRGSAHLLPTRPRQKRSVREKNSRFDGAGCHWSLVLASLGAYRTRTNGRTRLVELCPLGNDNTIAHRRQRGDEQLHEHRDCSLQG